MNDSFSRYHPILNFTFFIVVIGTTVFSTHPIILSISFFSAISYICALKGFRAMLKSLFCFALPVMVIISLMNPLFNHYGVTTLGYLSNGNPITLESIVYGLVTSLMFAAVILWFSCYNVVMTSDRFIYIFGKIIPGLSLILSMALRFVPRFFVQGEKIGRARAGIGYDSGSGSLWQRMKNAVANCSILITWALENAVDTADSMKARGYGSKKRTAYSIFYFGRKDAILTVAMTVFGIAGILGIVAGLASAMYNPVIKLAEASAITVVCYICYAIFCMLPTILHIVSVVRYRAMEKRIESNHVREWRLWEL